MLCQQVLRKISSKDFVDLLEIGSSATVQNIISITIVITVIIIIVIFITVVECYCCRCSYYYYYYYYYSTIIIIIVIIILLLLDNSTIIVAMLFLLMRFPPCLLSRLTQCWWPDLGIKSGMRPSLEKKMRKSCSPFQRTNSKVIAWPCLTTGYASSTIMHIHVIGLCIWVRKCCLSLVTRDILGY